MRRLFKRVASLVMIPLVRWYLRQERKFQYKTLTLRISPGVFHPGLFGSSKFLLDYIDGLSLHGKSILDVGTGSGALAIFAAKKGGIVTALDLSGSAIENTNANAKSNGVDIFIVQSDLFTKLSSAHFDYIFINPPYYPRPAVSEADLAWYCGEDFQYYKNLFRDLHRYLNLTSHVVMVLTKECPIQKISDIAEENGFRFNMLAEKKVLFDEKNFLFEIMHV